MAGESHPSRLSLVARTDDGSDERHILDVTEMTTDPQAVAAAAEAAWSGVRLKVREDDVPVFDLRAPESVPTAVDAGDQGSAAPHGCLLIGQRGGLRVALLVD
jgi:hypothetical protein